MPQDIRNDLKKVIEARLKLLLEACYSYSINEDQEMIELIVREEEKSISARIVIRLYFIDNEIHLSNITIPNAWRGKRIGMNLINDIFSVCRQYDYHLLITDMVESFYDYMLSIGANCIDPDTVQITPDTRLINDPNNRTET